MNKNMAAAPIPFIDLKSQYAELRQSVNDRIQRVLDHGQYILGPEVQEVETQLAAYTGAAECITVASGTEALLIALMALGVGPGDEVITTPFTFAATAEMIVLLGATPVFVDIERDTGNIDAAAIEARVTERTRAIMPVSLYGQAADMAKINAVAQRHGLTVIEDAAQSFGADYQGRKSCNLSTIGCTSFFPSKPLGCYGDGGALFTSDPALAQAFREIRIHGQSRRYTHTRIGVGGRMDTLQCAVLLAKLETFGAEVTKRLELGARYNRLIDAAGIRRVQQRRDRTSVFAQYSVFVDDRARVQAQLQAAGIPTAVHYPIILPEQPAYAHLGADVALPNARWAADHVMSLPMSPYLSEQQQDHIVQVLADVIARQESPAS